MKDFERLFEPRSIAVVGVSDDPVRPGSQAVHALIRNGFPGQIYPVNPKYPTYEGLRCYPSVSAVDGEIDIVVIGVPARAVLPVIEECANKGVRFAVVPSGGFRESGPEGAALQDRMVAIARKAGMRIIGPNCLGYVNVHSAVYAGFGSITRPPALQKGSVSLVTQSGGFGYSLALACAGAGIGFRNIIATGNEADLDTVTFLDALLDDPGTSAVVAYIEGLSNGRALLEVGRRALALGKPLLVWKGGITDEGAKAAASHTANLTGSYDVYRALFAQTGIVEIRELHEAVDYLKGFAARRFPPGRRVAVMGGSGGSAIVFADAAEQAGLTFSVFTDDTERKLREVIPAIGAVHNPVDFTAGYIAGGNVEKFATAVRSVLEDPGVDAVCLNFATTSAPACVVGANVLREVACETTKPIVVFLSTTAPDAVTILDDAGIPVVPSPVRAARLIARLAVYRELREHGVAQPTASERAASSLPPAGGTLSEAAAKALLADIGISTTRDVLVTSAEDARLDALQPPYAVKIASPDIPHKTEVDGVRLGVRDRAELVEAISAVLAGARKHAPAARVEGVLVSEMVKGGFELLAGSVNDPVFGPVIVAGAGGIHAEVMADTACRIAPFDERTAHEMLQQLRCRPILDGVRGQPALDVDAVAQALASLSQFAWAHRERIAEIDINPLFATPTGAIAADALIVMHHDTSPKQKENG